MKGILKDIFYDFSEKRTSVLLKIEGNVHDDLVPLKGKDVSISLKKYRKHRSKDANAYYWTLVGKLAKHSNLDNIQLHNQLLRRYSEPWTDEDGNLTTWLVPKDTDLDHMETEHFNIMETGVWFENREYIKVCLLLPSHLMNTKQMSRLIDGVVGECKEAGIETIPPDELEHMLAMWRPNEKAKSS